MTTMEMPMDNSENNLNSQVAAVDTAKPLNKKTLVRKSVFDSTYIKPLSIVGVIIALGIIVFMVKALTPEPELRTIDGGQASTIKVNKEVDGRDQLDVKQAQYLSEKDRIAAEKNAADGVTTAAILTRPEVNSGGTSYLATDTTDLGAVTSDYQSVPKTYQQLKAENEASNKTLYSEGMDENGNVVFISKSTGVMITPISATRSADAPEVGQAALNSRSNPNATYASTPQDYNGGGYNDSGNGANGGGQNNGGQNNGGGQGGSDQNNQNNQNQNNQGQNNQPRPPDPAIEAKRAQLSADYEAFQAQQASLDAQAAQAEKIRQDRYIALNEYRTKTANDSLNNAIGSIQKSTGGQNRYAPISYTNGGGQGGQQNNNGQPQTYSQQLNQNNTTSSSNQTPINSFDTNNSGFGGGGSSNGMNVGFGGQSSPQAGQYNGADGNENTGVILDNRLPANIIRAGTKWQAVITKSVNTDEGTQVIGELVTGKYAGSTVYGVVTQSGRDIGVQFTTIAPPNARKSLVPLAAYATTIGTQKSAVATDKKNHYLQNYGVKSLTSILRGVGDAYENSGETSIITDSGNVITTKESEPSSKTIRANVLGELGDEITADIGKLGNRAPTFKVAIGTVLNVVLSDNLDVNGTASSITRN